jgi:hypothetical protein
VKYVRALNPISVVLALFAAAFSASLPAQSYLTRQNQPAVETAYLALPDAPLPQNAPPTTPAAVSPSAASSSSQETAPTPPPTATPTPADAKQQQHDEAERELKVQEKQRLLGVMPQFQVVMGGEAVPLTGGQKWRLALHSAVDPFYIGWAFVIGGGWGEIVDSDRGYGWGDEGYFKRVGANYADNVNGAIIGNALLPQLLHQDPRYFRKGTGSFKSRFVYAALSNVLGNFISGAISNAYYPADERGVALTLENGLSVTLFGALGGQILEFGPDLSRLVHRKKGITTSLPTATTPAPAPAHATPNSDPQKK